MLGIVISRKQTKPIFHVFHKIEVNKDVTFDEYATFKKSRKTHVDEEEQENPRVEEISKPPVRDEEDPTPEV